MKYVAWSFEHRMWWGPNFAGYTPHLDQAGRYTRVNAGEIATKSPLVSSVVMLEKIAEAYGPPLVWGLWDKRYEEDSRE